MLLHQLLDYVPQSAQQPAAQGAGELETGAEQA